MKAAVRRQLENTTEIMETDEKLTMSVHHVKVTVTMEGGDGGDRPVFPCQSSL